MTAADGWAKHGHVRPNRRAPTAQERPRRGSRALAPQRGGRNISWPSVVFLCVALGLGLPVLSVPVVLDIDPAPFLLAMVFLGLLAPALVISRLADGPGAVRRLLQRAFDWRFGVGRWAVVLFAVPLLTLALAGVSGSLTTPDDGWLWMAGTYLFATVVFGALVINLWEETAWAGFLQTRLTARYGLVLAAVLTAVPFAVIHVPLYLVGNPSRADVLAGLAILFALAPVYRLLLGLHLLGSGGSVLAAGIQHASWNASGNLAAVEGEWQVIAAVVLLTAALAAERHVRRARRTTAPEDERAAAQSWLIPSAG